jgi:transposase InsO family protein
VLALANQRWSLDFVHDQMASARRFRVLNVVDDVTRECLAAVLETSISGHRVVRELTRLIAERGKPGMIVSDNVLGRDRAHQHRRPRMVRHHRRRVALHCSGQADVERLRRELQRPHAR